MRRRLSSFLLLAALHGPAAAGEPIPLQDSGWYCESADTGARLERLVRGTFAAVTSRAANRKQARLRHEIAGLDARYARQDKARLNQRGRPGYARMAQLQARTFQRRRVYRQLLADMGACLAGEVSTIDNVDDVLTPSVKTAWDPSVQFQTAQDLPDETPTQAFAYDADAYAVYEKTVHGITLTVALHRDTLAQAKVPFTGREFADALFALLHGAIDSHGGFAVDRFVFKVRAPGASSGFALCRGGVALSANDYDTLQQAHEPFHSWNGKLYAPTPDGTGNLFQVLTLVVEELTVYYSAYLETKLLYDFEFAGYMQYFWEFYLEHRNDAALDLPYAELAAKASENGTGASDARTMMNARGLLVFYAIDRALIEAGSSLDALVGALYRGYGLAGTQYGLQAVGELLTAAAGSSAVAGLLLDYGVHNGDLRALFGGDPSFEPLR